MIAALLACAARRARQADAAVKTDETTTLEFVGGRLRSATTATSLGMNLRLESDGRVGSAGTTTGEIEPLVARAVEAAREGEPGLLAFPPATALPAVITHVPRTAAASMSDLETLGALVRDRLGGDRADLAITVERTLGSVHVANTRGVDAAYDVSRVSLRVLAGRLVGGRLLTVEGTAGGADLPAFPEVEALVAALRQRLAWAERQVECPPGRHRVGFLPSALPLLLLPVEQALTGQAVLHGASTLAGRRGGRSLAEAITLRDEPLLDHRPGSRPVDDEGIPSRPFSLVNRGVVEGVIADLEMAGRLGVPPTGHGRRTTFGKPQAAFSNLVLAGGESGWQDCLAAIGNGLLVERVQDPMTAMLAGGTFARQAVLAWRVEGGEVTGLAPEVTLAGNAHDLLGRVVAVGQEQTWIGSRCLPLVVVDGVSVF